MADIRPPPGDVLAPTAESAEWWNNELIPIYTDVITGGSEGYPHTLNNC